MAATLDFSNVRERDMDLLFLEMLASDPGFLNLVASKTETLQQKPVHVLDIALSKADASLGESDITVILDVNGKRVGILIEDKIDAVAMPNQHKRYLSRGKKGVKNHEYDDFVVFIFCPSKYYDTNSEAKQYEHHLFYEECIDYLQSFPSVMGSIRIQQIEQAIQKAKKPPETQKNEAAIDYFIKYREYQKENYPHLDLRTKPGSNGWWTNFATPLGSTYILHKTQEGAVDLTFPNAAVRLQVMQLIADWLREHKCEKVISLQTGNASVLRIEVPKLVITKPYEETKESDIVECFEAISLLDSFAKICKFANELSMIKKTTSTDM